MARRRVSSPRGEEPGRPGRIRTVTPAPASFRDSLLQAVPRLRRYARTLVFDAAAADDLVQTTLEKALARWHQFDPSRELLVWLLSIAHNAHLDTVRRESRFTPLDPTQLQQEHERQAAATPTPDPGLRLDLLAALAQIPPEQREPLLLVCVEQLSYAECAELLGIPAGTVMSRVFRARAQLRGLLEGQPVACRRGTGSATLRRVV
jgi:RNA polymerase sigma-70 factor (ECF subfamily)